MRATRSYGVLSTVAAAVVAAAVGPAFGQSRVEKQFSMPPGGALALDAERGSVTVAGTQGSEARVAVTTATGDLAQLVDLQFTQHDGRLEILAKKKGGESVLGWLGLGSMGDLRFAIEVPEATQVAVQTRGGAIDVKNTRGAVTLDTSGGPIHVAQVSGPVSADTSGGSITVEDVDGDVVADTSGGSIHLENIRGSATADTSGGSIHVSQITGDLKADTSGGSIHVEGAGGRVDADTSGGSIDTSLVGGNSHGGKLNASGGGIRVALDPAADLSIDAEASGGPVTADLPFSGEVKSGKHSVHGTLGRGGSRLELRSSGGPIRIEKI